MNKAMFSEEEYRELISKYIDYVGECEGVIYIPSKDSDNMGVKFTNKEIDVLNNIMEAQDE